MQRLIRLAVAATVVVVLTTSSQAGVIGVNFNGGGQMLSATDSPGIVAGANWTPVVGGGGTSALGLTDSTGAITTANLLVNGGVNYDSFSGPVTSNPATSTMYMGGLFGLGTDPLDPNTEVSVTVSTIPYTSYNVYVYASADTTDTSILSVTIGSTTFYYNSDGTNMDSGASSLLLTTSTDPGNPTSGSAQYQIFTGLTGSSFTLTTGGSLTGVLSNNVFGLEIVSNDAIATPEPASLMMAGVGALIGVSLVLSRRRRAMA